MRVTLGKYGTAVFRGEENPFVVCVLNPERKKVRCACTGMRDDQILCDRFFTPHPGKTGKYFSIQHAHNHRRKKLQQG